MNIQDGFYRLRIGANLYTRKGYGWFLNNDGDWYSFFEEIMWQMEKADYEGLNELELPMEYLK